MSHEPDAGHYARKQILCPSRLIAWAHRRRFDTALQLSKIFSGKNVLDLGCGDGTFLHMLLQQDWAPNFAVGAEITTDLVDDCTRRLGAVEQLRFLSVEDLESPDYQAAFDGVFCMEVLEHVIDVDEVLDQLRRLVSPDGRVLISVPVEIGLPMLVKQSARRVAGWMGVGDYPGTTPYTITELLAGLVAGPRQHLDRPVHVSPEGHRFFDHKGFNWKLLREKLSSRFTIERATASPITWLPPQLGSQCWFLLRPQTPSASK